MDRFIRNSAKALIIRAGKMLAVKLNDNGDIFYIMPGGGQNCEELLPDAVRREVLEELGLEVDPKELVFIIEGAHKGTFHRVDHVFLCDYIDKIENVPLHADLNQIGFDWLDIETLNTQPLYPSKLRRQIMNLHEGRPYITYLGNEEEGDPECLD